VCTNITQYNTVFIKECDKRTNCKERTRNQTEYNYVYVCAKKNV